MILKKSTVCLEAILLLFTSIWSYYKLSLIEQLAKQILTVYSALIFFSSILFIGTLKYHNHFYLLLFTNRKQYRFQVDFGLLTATLLPPLVCSAKIVAIKTNDLQKWDELLLLSIFNSFSVLIQLILNQPKKSNHLFFSIFSSSLFVIQLPWEFFYQYIYKTLFSTLVFQISEYLILLYIPGSFTLGELSLISQGLTFLFLNGINLCIKPNELNNPFSLLNSKPSEEFVLLSGLILGMLLIGLLFSFINNKISKNNLIKSIIFYIITISVVFIIISPIVESILGKSPFVWIFQYILNHKSALKLISYWMVSVLIGIVYSKTVLEGSSLNSRRKYFHGLATLLFIPGYFIDPKLLYIAFAVALALFILLEYLRYFSILPFGNILHEYLIHFLDEKDQGIAILAHIYLLLGCALPIWFKEKNNDSCNLSGILVLGLADAAASIIGKKFGHMKWPNSNKTIKGTFGFIIALFVSFLLIDPQMFWNINKLTSMIIISILNGLLEAWSEQNDNLILPLYLFSSILLF